MASGKAKGGGNGGSTSSSSAMIRRELSRFFLSGVKWTGRPSFGVGAYGSVEPLELHGMLCAGKKIHDVLVDVGNDGADDIAARFVEECKMMSELRHPHVVQFLGLCVTSTSPLPILVMEHLHCSLDDLLEGTPDIPLYMKRAILRDVALGLAHLHGRSPSIIHRDLTARNVLLNSNMQAKLADFGVARILNLPAGKLEATLSRVPGTSTYMPPEVFNREAKYNTAVDIFSFGHLLLFTITQKQPGVEAATYVDSSGRIVARSEIERREDSVVRMYGILGREHLFVTIMTDCLQTNPLLRPSVLQVLTKLEEMKSSIRDPYSRQTRLTLTQMIRKKAAENKRIAAELKTAQEDLLNAKRRIVHLTDKLHRYSQQLPPTSPTSSNDYSKHNYYNTADGSFLKENQHGYDYINEDVERLGQQTRTFSSPSLASNSTVTSPPPPLPQSPRPHNISPDEHPSLGEHHCSDLPSLSSSQLSDLHPPFLTLPRTINTRHLSHENLHSDPDYMKVEEVTHRKHSTGVRTQVSPFYTNQFLSESESDSDFDEVEPNFMRRSPQGGPPSLGPLMGSLPTSSVTNSLSYESSPHYHTHLHASSSSQYPTQPSLFGSSGPPSFLSSPRSLSLGPTVTSYDSGVPHVSVKTAPDATTSLLRPLTTGMAGKLYFYTDLDPNTLLLLHGTEQGRIPGVRYETETGQVQIESDSAEKTRLASEKFQSAYAYATSNQVSLTLDVPGDVAESTVEEIISTHTPHFGKSTVSYNGLESSLQVVSFSGSEIVKLKQALAEAIQKVSASVSKLPHDGASRSGNITGRTQLLIKKGNLSQEDSDVIVFPNTSNLACKDGVAKAVDEASQGVVLKQCKTFITKHGLLGFGETILMKSGGRLKAKFIIHVNPGVGSYINLQAVLRKLVTQSLKLAANKSVSSIAFCPLVPNWTESNIGMIAQTMLEGIKLFAADRRGRKLRQIRIVVREQTVFDCFSELAKLS